MRIILCLKPAPKDESLFMHKGGCSMDEFVRLYQIVSLTQGVLVVAAAADNDEDKDDPENPATVVFATAIEKAAHR
jgi:hypothetical protein